MASGMAKNHKIWFDKECADKRSELREFGKQASREPKSSKTRMDLNFKKKTFENLYIGKQLLFENYIIGKMHDAQTMTQKDFSSY